MRTRKSRMPAVLLIAHAITGCATVTAVDTGSEASIRVGLEVGDRVALVTGTDQRYEFRVAELCDLAVAGVDAGGDPVTIAFEDIAGLFITEPRPARTAAAVTGVLAVSALAVSYPAYALAGVIWGWE